jgi:molybdopterin synthase sulfur carrier subunit
MLSTYLPANTLKEQDARRLFCFSARWLHMPRVEVELIGTLNYHVGFNRLLESVPDRSTVLNLLKALKSANKLLGDLIIDEAYGKISVKVLVLVNGREISALNGLDTQLNDGDKVTLIPFSHGG